MKFKVKINTNKKTAKIEKSLISEYDYVISVRSKAQEGKANNEIISLMSEYFDIPKTNIKILIGNKSKIKLIEIL